MTLIPFRKKQFEFCESSAERTIQLQKVSEMLKRQVLTLRCFRIVRWDANRLILYLPVLKAEICNYSPDIYCCY